MDPNDEPCATLLMIVEFSFKKALSKSLKPPLPRSSYLEILCIYSQ